MKKKRSAADRALDRELISKGREALKDFDKSEALRVPVKKRESKLISIRLPMSMIGDLRDAAVKKGDIGYQQLIKILIADGLARLDPNHLPLHQKNRYEVEVSRDDFLDNSFSLSPETELPFTAGVYFDRTPARKLPGSIDAGKRRDPRWKWTLHY